MQIEQTLLIALFALGASFVQRVSGFGFGIFIMTLLPHVMPSYGEATALSGLLASVTSLIIVARMYKHIVWSKLWLILAAFLATSFFAVSMVRMIDSAVLKKALGVILIGVSLYFIFLRQRIKPRATRASQIGLGSLSGLMGVFCGMKGPPAVLYFIEVAKQKEEYIALAQTFFVIGNFMMTVFRWRAGFVTAEVLTDWLWALPTVLLGTWVGSIVFRHLSLDLLRHIVFIYIGISGLIELLF